ncbi:MAG: hypothetical protein K8S55_04440 [Phycisphaerae bacterium]|nr:hypothetical protein [Phycisphaerae bacterium]
MVQPVTLRISMPLGQVGVIGAEEEKTPEQEMEAMQAEFDARLQQARQGMELERAQLVRSGEALAAAGLGIEELRGQLIEEIKRAAVDLAMTIARKVLAQRVEAGDFDIDPIVAEAIGNLPPQGEIVVRLSGGDLKRCGLASQAKDAVGGRIRFVADPGVSPGGCVVESVEGRVESSVVDSLEQVGKTIGAEDSPERAKKTIGPEEE